MISAVSGGQKDDYEASSTPLGHGTQSEGMSNSLRAEVIVAVNSVRKRRRRAEGSLRLLETTVAHLFGTFSRQKVAFIFFFNKDFLDRPVTHHIERAISKSVVPPSGSSKNTDHKIQFLNHRNGQLCPLHSQ